MPKWHLTGAKVKAARLRRKLSQRQVAERLGISSHTTVGRWEKGSVPGGFTAVALIKMFPELIPHQVGE